MLGKPNIQWCPSCKAWERSSRVKRDRIEGIAEAGDHAAISFVYHRHEHQCHRCDGQFTTTSLHHCETVHSWRAMRSIRLAATAVPAEAASATDSLEAAAG